MDLRAFNDAIGGEAMISLSVRAIAVRHAILPIMVFVVVNAIAMCARAEVFVTCELHAISVEARDTSLQEVLAALASSCDLQYQTSVDLNRPVSGTFSGSLRHIVKQLLGNMNYFMRGSDNKVEVIIVGAPGAAPIVKSMPAPRAVPPVPTSIPASRPVPPVATSVPDSRAVVPDSRPVPPVAPSESQPRLDSRF
jgi:hypothetical protein